MLRIYAISSNENKPIHVIVVSTDLIVNLRFHFALWHAILPLCIICDLALLEDESWSCRLISTLSSAFLPP